jgi:hypothetical protein
MTGEGEVSQMRPRECLFLLQSFNTLWFTLRLGALFCFQLGHNHFITYNSFQVGGTRAKTPQQTLLIREVTRKVIIHNFFVESNAQNSQQTVKIATLGTLLQPKAHPTFKS